MTMYTIKREKEIRYTNTSIVESGSSEYVILVSKDATKSEVYAGELLSEYVYKMTEARIPIVKENDLSNLSTRGKYISVGKTQLLDSIELDWSISDFNTDGFIQKTVDNSLFLCGGESQRGTFYAIFDYLERCLGARFFAPDCEKIPRHEKIVLPDLDVVDVPAFARRVLVTNVLDNPDYQLKSRLFGYNLNFEEKYGETYSDFVWGFQHNVAEVIVPKSKYIESHPEWYYFVDGNHPMYNFIPSNGVKDDGSYDDTLDINPVDVAVESLKKGLLESNAYYLNCSYADCDMSADVNPVYTQRVKKYQATGVWIQFLNLVCERLDKWIETATDENGEKLFPNGREYSILTLSYITTRHAPVDEQWKPLVKAHKNIAFWLAPIQLNCLMPINHPKQYPDARDMLPKWRAVSDNLAIWDYFSCFYSNDLYYMPLLSTLQKTYQYYVELNMHQFLFSQMNGSEWEIAGGQAALKVYLASKLMWDPYHNNVRDLVKEFCEHYYGEYAKDVLEVMKRAEERFAFALEAKEGDDPFEYMWKHSATAGQFNGNEFLSLELLTDCVEILENAIERNKNSDKPEAEKSIFDKRLKHMLTAFYAPLVYEHTAYYKDESKYPEMLEKLFTLIRECGCGEANEKSKKQVENVENYYKTNGPRKNRKLLVRDGMTDYKILLAETPTEEEKLAGETLSKYIERITGTLIPVVYESECVAVSTEKEFLSVGATKLLKAVALNVPTDGYVQKTVDNTLFLCGGMDGKGTLYAVYDYLKTSYGEKYLRSNGEFALNPVIFLQQLDEVKKEVKEEVEIERFCKLS